MAISKIIFTLCSNNYLAQARTLGDSVLKYSDSKFVIGLVDQNTKEKMLKYMGAKHGFIIHQRYWQYFLVMDQIQKHPFSYFLRILYYKYIKRQPFIK